MPSLRRTTSSPVVRSSPYPSSLSSSSHMLSSGGNRPKRTASDSVTRRVLADIEWWRVFDGQQEEYFVEQASNASRDDTFVLGSALHDHLDMDSLRPSTPVNRDESGGQVSICKSSRPVIEGFNVSLYSSGISSCVLLSRVYYFCYCTIDSFSVASLTRFF